MRLGDASYWVYLVAAFLATLCAYQYAGMWFGLTVGFSLSAIEVVIGELISHVRRD